MAMARGESTTASGCWRAMRGLQLPPLPGMDTQALLTISEGSQEKRVQEQHCSEFRRPEQVQRPPRLSPRLQRQLCQHQAGLDCNGMDNGAHCGTWNWTLEIVKFKTFSSLSFQLLSPAPTLRGP